MNKRGAELQDQIIQWGIGLLLLAGLVWILYSAFSGGADTLGKIKPDVLTTQGNLCKTLYLPLGEIDYCKYREIELDNGKTGYVNCDYDLLKPIIGANPLQGTCSTKGYTAQDACSDMLKNIDNKANEKVYFKNADAEAGIECDLTKAGA